MIALISYFVLIFSIIYVITVLGLIINSKPNKPYNDTDTSTNRDGILEKLKKYASSQGEEVLGVLGAQNAIKYLETTNLKNGFCFITDKASYFIGNVYQRKSMFLFRQNIQHRIINSELKGIKVSSLSKYVYFLLAIFSVILESLLFFWIYNGFIVGNPNDFYSASSEFIITINSFVICSDFFFIFAVFILGAYCFLEAFVLKKTFICMEFSNITIAFPIHTIGEQEAKDFYKIISRVQDHERQRKLLIASSQNTLTDSSSSKNAIASTYDKIASLKELSELYAQKLIDEQEYNKLKDQLINQPENKAE